MMMMLKWTKKKVKKEGREGRKEGKNKEMNAVRKEDIRTKTGRGEQGSCMEVKQKPRDIAGNAEEEEEE